MKRKFYGQLTSIQISGLVSAWIYPLHLSVHFSNYFLIGKSPNLCVIVLLAEEKSFYSLVLKTSVISLVEQVESNS